MNKILLTIFLLFAMNSVAFSEDNLFNDNWTGDYDGMVERKLIRVLVVYNKMLYFLDGPRQRGASYDVMTHFGEFVNKKLNTKTLKLRIVYIPVARDQLIPALLSGKGDIAAANLTITPQRQSMIDFSDPLLSNVQELLVTSAGLPGIEKTEDLSGQAVFVRQSSSYANSLKLLNSQLGKKGLAPVKINYVDEFIEDSDLLEMLNAGLISATVVDSHKADFWAEIFKNIRVNKSVVLRDGGKIGWAFRKNSPQFSAIINEFAKDNKKGSLMGNMIFKRYLKTNKWARNSLDEVELKKFDQLIIYFKKYADQYSFDWLTLAALGYQESHLDQSKKSHAGAIGVMQLLPTTAADKNVGIPDIYDVENNIHAGTKYLHFLRKRYFDDAAISPDNKLYLSFAAYNAGPARVRRLRAEAKEQGYDPNKWFGNVEVIAARRVGRETVQYVSNIHKYYLAYQLVSKQLAARREAKKAIAK